MLNNGSASYVYDGENRLVWASGYRYLYDGDGKRVEKCLATSSTTPCPTSGTNGTLYWTGIGSDPLDESDLGGHPQEEYIFFNSKRIARRDVSSNGTTIAVHYYFSDHLGSTSLVTDQNGTMSPHPQSESDYYPYGGEIVITSGDPNHYKFTGKERDAESGLDLMGARHYSSALGRFAQPDPLYIEAHRLADPQQLSLYTYVLNNPLAFTDPTGMDIALSCSTIYGNSCDQAVLDLNKRKGAGFKVKLGKDGKLQVVKGSVGKNLSKAEVALLGAITDSKNHATINVSGNTGQSEFGEHVGRGVNSVDVGNLSKLDAASNAADLNSGDALAHEAMDAYLSLSMGEAADQAASDLYPGLKPPTESLNTGSTTVTGAIQYQPITDGRGGESITFKYNTPVPWIELFGKTAEERNQITHAAGSRVTGVTYEPKQ